MAGLEHPPRPRRRRDRLTAEFDGYRPGELLETRRPRVVPHRFLAWSRFVGSGSGGHERHSRSVVSGQYERCDPAARRPARPPARRGIADAGALPRDHRARGGADRRSRRWGEFGAFGEYQPTEAAHWLAVGNRGGLPPAARSPPGPHPDQRDGARRRRGRGRRAACPVPGRAHREGEGCRTGSVAGRRRGPRQRRTRRGADGAGRRQRRLDGRGRGGRGARRSPPTAHWSTSNNPARRWPSSPRSGAASTFRSPPTRASARPTTRCTWCAAGPPTSRCSRWPRWAGCTRCWPSPRRSTSPSWCPARWTRR